MSQGGRYPTQSPVSSKDCDLVKMIGSPRKDPQTTPARVHEELPQFLRLETTTVYLFIYLFANIFASMAEVSQYQKVSSEAEESSLSRAHRKAATCSEIYSFLPWALLVVLTVAYGIQWHSKHQQIQSTCFDGQLRYEMLMFRVSSDEQLRGCVDGPRYLGRE